MTNRPCPENVLCVETPTINLSAEAPDPIQFIGVAFRANGFCLADSPFDGKVFGGQSVVCFSEISQEQADRCAQEQGLHECLPEVTGCVTGCPEHHVQPDDPVNDRLIYWNTPQSCQVCCTDGPCATYTVRAGIFPADTLAEANANAYSFACRQATLLLPEICRPTPPVDPPPKYKVFWNDPQTCSAACPDGSTFFYTQPAATFADITLAKANARALAYACQQAKKRRFCMGDLNNKFACIDNIYQGQITESGGDAPFDWNIISGNLPPGVSTSVAANSRALFIDGTPMLPGNYTFTVRLTDLSGGVIDRTFTISVLGILEDSPLPNGKPNTAYSQQLTPGGGEAPYTFFLAEGALPDGLTLSSDGLISGTPTQSEFATFTVGLTDSTGRTCLREYDLDVAGFFNTLQCYSCADFNGPGYFDSNKLTLPADEQGIYVQDGVVCIEAGRVPGTDQADADAQALTLVTDRFVELAVIGTDIECSKCDDNVVSNIADLTWGTYREGTTAIAVAGGDGTFSASGTTGPVFHMFGFGPEWANRVAGGGPGTFGGNSNPPGLCGSETYIVTVTVTFTKSGLGPANDTSGALNASLFKDGVGVESFSCQTVSPWVFQFEVKAYHTYSLILCEGRYIGTNPYNLSATITLRPLTPP